LVEPSLEQVSRLHILALGGDKTHNGDSPLGDMFKRAKSAGALVVVFQEETVVLELRKNAFGDRVVVPLAMPLRHDLSRFRVDRSGIPFAQMDSESYPGEVRDDRVIRGDRTLDIPI